MANHQFRWVDLSEIGPVYECDICSSTITASNEEWTPEEFERGDYLNPPDFLNESLDLPTCEEIIVQKIQVA